MRLFDAHNHLQDERFDGQRRELMQSFVSAGGAVMVVNGSSEDDWAAVLRLAHQHPQVIPSFGYHPWYVAQRTPEWRSRLDWFLERTPSAVGEIGLDRWRKDVPYEGQEEVFLAQLDRAARRNLPVTIHCLQAWGRLHDLLRANSRPDRGFLLHSYGGSLEMVGDFVQLGAYFSLPGYFAHERKGKQRAAFRGVPPDRLLIETDAPDQALPEALNTHPCQEKTTGRPLNHPANITAVYDFGAGLVDESPAAFATRIEANFRKFFGDLVPSTA